MSTESETTFAFVLRDTSANLEKNIQAIKSLTVPQGYRAEIVIVSGNGSMASAYNLGMKQSSAKYKIYVGQEIKSVSVGLLSILCMYFGRSPFPVGMVGLWGSEIPADGDYTKARSVYGRHAHIDQDGNIQIETATEPVFFQEVRCLDNAFVATALDIEWDERVGDDFAVAAQCLRFREKGYKVIVAMQCWANTKYLIAFNSPNRYRMTHSFNPSYDEERKQFMAFYRQSVLPLVSILIPTYNQPEFFRAALESALAQDYGNIEIVVGDDSTDDRTKRLIEPYLAKYPQIRYYYHGGPLRTKGGNNIDFVLAKSKGEYINYLFHDDLFYPTKISKMMYYYLTDLSGEIGLVTSVRDGIDEDGKKCGVASNYNPLRGRLLSSVELGQSILCYTLNYIGEATTVLLPKACLYVPEINDFRLGYFCGVKDESMGDVSTWLDIGRRYKRAIFLSEALSAFRTHAGQNTFNPRTQICCCLDWYMLTVVAWLNGVYIDGEDACFNICRNMSFRQKPLVDPEKLTGELTVLYQKYAAICQAAIEGKRDLMFHLIISYAMEKAADPERFRQLCEKDALTGYWRKRQNKVARS